LYLSKKARPDIISVVIFLCTRVKGPTDKDWTKLWRLLGYLRGTEEKVMKIRLRGIFKVTAHIDASFSSYPDGKSHSGKVIKVG
jgi:hypothetical protein